MFAYCLNNPCSHIDNCGSLPISTISKPYVIMLDPHGGSVVLPPSVPPSNTQPKEKPIIQRLLEHITTTDESDSTFSVGLTAAVSGYGPGIGGTTGIAVDSAYNYSGFGSINYGVGSSIGISAMGGINFQFTNADVVTDLGGVSKAYGFSAAFGVGIAVDVVHFIPASNPSSTCWGASVTIGLGIGFDIHASQSNTAVAEPWNPWKGLCDWLFGG